LKLLKKHPSFSFSLSITGVLIEQLQKYAPDVLKSFQDLVDTKKVELVSETYYHSLASIYSLKEFCEQIIEHRNLIKSVFGVKTNSFRNTELIYDNHIASIIKEMGFKLVIAEGWDKFLGWRNSNYIYEASTSKLSSKEKKIIKNYQVNQTQVKHLKLLLKNYKLSDDIAFRFSDHAWKEHPLSVQKYINWIKTAPGPLINLFMDYETFGEHQWEDTGIFEFLEKFVNKAFKENFQFKTISQAAKGKPEDKISIETLTSWADLERDVSAWQGNKMQQTALKSVYELEDKMMRNIGKIKNNLRRKYYIDMWRKLQISDHFYYMSTKYWTDGDVHKYFSPYDSPYEAFINYMNIIEDFTQRIEFEGKSV
jgi:alpha-amylase